MKEFFKKLISQLKCSHDYEYQRTFYERKLAQPHSENPFWYTEEFIRLKCFKCDKKIKKDYDWCKDNNLPTHEPIRQNRKRNFNLMSKKE